MSSLHYFIRIFIIVLFSYNTVRACTDVRLTAKDGTVLIARSMEFATDMKSNLRSSTRGRNYITVSPENKPTMTWKAKYGYLYLDGFDQDFAIEGMNEAGLSFEALYLPGETQYQAIPAGKELQAIPYAYFGDWVLSSFASVDEVKQALQNVSIFAEQFPGFPIIFPLHFSIQDKSGKGSPLYRYTEFSGLYC